MSSLWLRSGGTIIVLQPLQSAAERNITIKANQNRLEPVISCEVQTVTVVELFTHLEYDKLK